MHYDILFTWELGGGLGHIARLRPLAEAMIQQGKRVAFAVRDTKYCATIFGNTNIQWFQAPIKLGRPRRENSEPRTFADLLTNVGFGEVDELYAQSSPRSSACASTWRRLRARGGVK